MYITLFTACWTSSRPGVIVIFGMANVAKVLKNGRLSFFASPPKALVSPEIKIIKNGYINLYFI